jgi:hypothetical protein
MSLSLTGERRTGFAMPQLPGIDARKADATCCMVLGCNKTGLYRTGRVTTARGYCSEHKALAVRPRHSTGSAEYLARYIESWER